MPASVSYAHEKIAWAVDDMATTEGTVRERLLAAFMKHVIHVHPVANSGGTQISGETAHRIETLLERASGPNGAIETGIQGLDEDEIHELATELTSIHRQLAVELHQREDPR